MHKRNIHKRFQGSVAVVAAVAVASLPLVIPATAHAQVPPPPEGEVAAEPAPAPVTGPDPADANLTEEQKLEKAKGLYIEAEEAFQAGDYATATNRYERAYYLVPGKHGFAYKVGLAAWNLGDCKKADDYFKHFVKYETDYETKGDKIEEAKRIIGEIAISGCAEQAEEPAPAPAATQPAAETGPVVGDEPDLTSAEDKRKQQEEASDREANDKAVSGLMIGGITMVVLGAGGLGLGIGSFIKARSNANELSDLSSNGTQTGFPEGDFSQESTFKMNSQIKTFNTLSVVGFTVGGVLLAGGGVLIGLDVAKRKKAEKQAALKDHKRKVKLTGVSPTWMPGGGGAAASLSF